jgi:hypothetical protein
MTNLETTIPPIHVMSVKANGGTKGTKEAFDTLESKLPSLKGRRFYGAYDPLTGEYRACVEMVQGEDPVSLGFDRWTIPGGTYVTKKLINWNSKIQQLPQMFGEMASGQKVDSGRPSVEYYRSQSELVLYLPVKR